MTVRFVSYRMSRFGRKPDSRMCLGSVLAGMIVAVARQQPKLHQAMQSILLDQPAQTATMHFLAKENRVRDLYRTANGDGPHPSANQFGSRARHYKDFQVLPDGRLKFIRMCEPSSVFLFTWMPSFWPLDNLLDLRNRWNKDIDTTEDWSSGARTNIPAGAKFYLIKKEESPKGIFASGVTASGWFPSLADGSPNFNRLRFDIFLDPSQNVLSVDQLQDISTTKWNAHGSGTELTEYIAAPLARRWSDFIAGIQPRPAGSWPSITPKAANDNYAVCEEDSRISALKQIKLRRGQRVFRDRMVQIYGGRCSISGCEILDVLEAAHIKPYLGEPDHHDQNGLLLRADLHTLFDLMLIAIDPATFRIHLHPSLRSSEYKIFDGAKLRSATPAPSVDALSRRWREFQTKLL